MLQQVQCLVKWCCSVTSTWHHVLITIIPLPFLGLFIHSWTIIMLLVCIYLATDGYLLRMDELPQFTSTLHSFHPAQYYWFGRLALRCDLSRLFISHLLHSPQRCRIRLHSYLACEESPSVNQVSKVRHRYALLKITLVSACSIITLSSRTRFFKLGISYLVVHVLSIYVDRQHRRT
jgi:hypothetical protein